MPIEFVVMIVTFRHTKLNMPRYNGSLLLISKNDPKIKVVYAP